MAFPLSHGENRGSSPLGSANLSKNLIFPTEDGVPVVSRETAPRVQPSAAAFRPVPFLSLSPTGIQRHSTHQSSNPLTPATHSRSMETVAVCGKHRNRFWSARRRKDNVGRDLSALTFLLSYSGRDTFAS